MKNTGMIPQIKTTEQARQLIKDRDLSHIKVGVFDIDGILRGKYMDKEKFLHALENGFSFCDVVLGWDSADVLYDNVNYTGWHTGYPDVQVRLLPSSCRNIPFEDDMLLFLAEFDGAAEAICPRGTLKRIIEKASSMGYNTHGSCEFEFFVFNETPHSVREKNYQNLNNFTPGAFGYSMLRSTVESEFYNELFNSCQQMGITLEGLHTETGPGVIEAAIQVNDTLTAADNGALFKTFAKILAQRSGRMATFMAKWSPKYAGQSGHLHLSLTSNKSGESVFYQADKEYNMSDTMRWFVGGQQKLMPELLAMIALTVNSYTRLIPGFWAPTASSWGYENRTCALRAIGGSAKSQRVEYRVAAADINPYIALAAALGSGLWGIENKIEPDPPILGNAYDHKHPQDRQLPRTLFEAANALHESNAARELFGDAFVEHYAASRIWEEREFRKHITDWEMQRYFEII